MQQYYSAIILLTCASLGVLGMLVRENSRLDHKSKQKFYGTYAVIILAALSEWAGVMLNGAPEWTRTLHAAVKFLDYVLTPVAGMCFVFQVSRPGKRQRYMWATLGANALFQLVSMFIGWTFYLDEGNVYHHGPLYFVYMLVYCLAIFAVLYEFFRYGRNYEKQNRGSLYLAMVFLAAAIAMQEIAGVRVSYFAMAVCSAMLFIHYSEFSQMKSDSDLSNQRKLLETDVLTGLYSRYAYTNELAGYDEQAAALSDDLVVFSIDVNGLKKTNDTLGHLAGDELIQGAARCVSIALGDFGKCFRTGGDEFIAILHADRGHVEALKIRLYAEAAVWKGNRVKALALSAGVCLSKDHPGVSIEKLISIADQAMYEEKRRYYQQEGHDRRVR